MFRFERFSRGVFVIDALVAWFFLVGARAVTSGIDSYLRKVRVRGRRVLVYGAGRGGTLLVREILQNPAAGFQPVGFIDDDPQKAANASRRDSGARRRRQPGGRRHAS